MKTKEDIHKKGKIVRMKLLGVDPVSGIIREDAQYKMKQHIIHSKIAIILERYPNAFHIPWFTACLFSMFITF